MKVPSLFYLAPIVFLIMSCADSTERLIYETEEEYLDYFYEVSRKTEQRFKDVISRQDLEITEPDRESMRLVHNTIAGFGSYINSINPYVERSPGTTDFYSKEYPLEEVQKNYEAAFTKVINAMPPELVKVSYKPLDLISSPTRKAFYLTTLRMKTSLLQMELDMLHHAESRTDPAFEFYKDGDQPVFTETFPAGEFAHRFAVSSKFVQQFPYRQIVIDSILRDGKIVKPSFSIGDGDILYMVELRGLKRGKYQIRGGDVKPYRYSFEIR